jgi:CBS domain-containing protein
MKPLLVEDLMSTSLLTVRDTDALGTALTTMGSASIHHLPVVDANYRVVGLLSDRDLLRGLAGSMTPSSPVSALMTRQVRCTRAASPAADAARLMIDQTISSLPVENEAGVLVGIVTSRDMLAVAEKALRGGRLTAAPER